MSLAGIVLAAGAGRRLGQAKATLRRPDGTSYVDHAVDVLRGAGVDPLLVVVGAEAAAARAALTRPAVQVVEASDWADGMGASLRAGIRGLGQDATAVLVTLVDLPDLTADVAQRVALSVGRSTSALGRAAFSGRPGHPVLIGRDHWAPVAEAAQADVGARDYLAGASVHLVECSDLAHGADVDTSAAYRAHLGPTAPIGLSDESREPTSPRAEQ